MTPLTIAENALPEQPHVNGNQHRQKKCAKACCRKKVARYFSSKQQRAQAFRQLMQWIELNGSCQKRNLGNREVSAGGETNGHNDEKERQSHVIDARKNRREIKPDCREREGRKKKQRDDTWQPDPMQRQSVREAEPREDNA